MTPTARSRRASASRKFAIGLLSAALLSLLPALALGAWIGAVTIRRVSQVQFERYVLVLVALSALLLLV